jgi:hypothetical protein
MSGLKHCKALYLYSLIVMNGLLSRPSLVGTLTGRFWPILLKKSTSVSTTEKYAFEIEIRALRRGFKAQI